MSLALYMLIRMIITATRDGIITSKLDSRQAKVVFDYMERIWDKAPILQKLFQRWEKWITHGNRRGHLDSGDSLTCFASRSRRI